MNVTIQTSSGSKSKLSVANDCTVCQLKIEIGNILAFSPDDQKLLFDNTSLSEDNKRLSEYGIGDGSVIHFSFYARDAMCIFARTVEGKTVAFEICKNDKIIDIKKKVQEKIGLAPHEQKLVFQGRILDDDKTADEYQIKERSVINVVARLSNSIQIFPKTMDGKIVCLYISKNDKIIDIKKKLHEKIGLAPYEQELFFHGGILDDDKIVDEYQIKERSVINVVARLRGVMKIFVKTMDEKTVAFEICKTDKIIDIKKRVQEKIGLAPHEQKLVFQGGILEDDKTADEYQIAERSVINVLKR